jgi:hypothetical protein
MNNNTRNSYQRESPRDRITRLCYWLGSYQEKNTQIKTQQPSKQNVISQQTTTVPQVSSNKPTYIQVAGGSSSI